MGSWKIIEMSFPRTFRISSSSSFTRSRPCNIMLPAAISPFGGSRRMTAAATVLLPHPDSPTTPTISPGPHVEICVPNGSQHAVPGVVLDREVADLEQRPGHTFRHHALLVPDSFGSSTSRSVSANNVKPERGDREGEPGPQDGPRGVPHKLEPVRQDNAPGRRRGPHAQPQERESGLERDHHGQVHRREDQQGRQHVRQDVRQQDAPVRCAQRTPGFHIELVPGGEDLRARHARIGRNPRDSDDKDLVDERRRRAAQGSPSRG
jgi:hypothetical protein